MSPWNFSTSQSVERGGVRGATTTPNFGAVFNCVFQFEQQSNRQLEDVERRVDRARASTTSMKGSVSCFKSSNPNLSEKNSSTEFSF